MKSKAPAEDPAARAARERDRRLSELARADTTMEQADGLTADLREVYGLRRLGRPGAVAIPGRQPGAAPMPNSTRPLTTLERQAGSFGVTVTNKGSGVTQKKVTTPNQANEWGLLFQKVLGIK